MNALTTRVGAALAPTTYSEARDFAQMIAGSDLAPKDYRGKPANVMVAMQMGSEVGLSPMQALQNIAVVNGRPALWGDAALAVVRAHPSCRAVREGVEGEGDARFGWCEVTRGNEPPIRRTFSVADAKKAGLWGKQGPWQQYPDRMLQLRARGFATRDAFPDALRGLITAEEAQDIPAEPLPPARGPVVDSTAAAAEPAREATLPLVSPDGEVVSVSLAVWLRAVERAIGKIGPDPAALAKWRAAMDEHCAEVREHDASMWGLMDSMAQEALDAAAERAAIQAEDAPA